MLDFIWKMSRPGIFSLDPETAHRLFLGSLHDFPRLHSTFFEQVRKPTAKHLQTRIAGLSIPSPIGLAAGLDKDGEAIPFWPSLGFGFVEIGTVTAHPQSGNPKPRLFRLVEEEGLINRMGFNNQGSEALRIRLESLHNKGMMPTIPVGANIGKSKVTSLEDAHIDYQTSARRLNGLVQYFTVNVSSPNTPGLRSLQTAENLKRILGSVQSVVDDTPIFVKFSPDMDEKELAFSIEAVIGEGVSGIIATNTTNSRPGSTGRLGESGGLSGDPLWESAFNRINLILDMVDQRAPVVGVGGVNSPERAERLLTQGCKAVQLYSALIFQGPGLISRINQHLANQ